MRALSAAPTSLAKEINQQIGQAFVSGDLMQTSSGAISAVAGLEARRFKYKLDPGAAGGAIYGFNQQSAAEASNKFDDVFAELAVPLAKNQTWAQSANFSLAYRNSSSSATDAIKAIDTPKKRSNAFAANLDWQPNKEMRVRGSVQRSVRAPNFGELFDGGGGFPSFFNPCSVTSLGRTTGADAAKLGALCAATGVANPTFVATPGAQAEALTSGNIDLKPESSTSVTLGLVWTPRADGILGGIRGSVDYYHIKVKDAITVPDVNEFHRRLLQLQRPQPELQREPVELRHHHPFGQLHHRCLQPGRFGRQLWRQQWRCHRYVRPGLLVGMVGQGRSGSPGSARLLDSLAELQVADHHAAAFGRLCRHDRLLRRWPGPKLPDEQGHLDR
jgi:hypothetical protein